MPPGVSSRGIVGGGGTGGGSDIKRASGRHPSQRRTQTHGFSSGFIIPGGPTEAGQGAAAALGLLALVGGPLGIAAALIGFGIGAIGGLRAKKETEELARERMGRIQKMMIQANLDAAIEQDEIGRGVQKGTGQARVFSETQENMSLDLRMAEDIIAEGARQNWAVDETNKRQQEAMQLAKEDISKDLRSQPKPIVSAVQAAMNLGEAANILSGSIINAVGAANNRNRQQDKDDATNWINQSQAEGGRVRINTGNLINTLMRQRNRFAQKELTEAIGGALNIFGGGGNKNSNAGWQW